MVDRPAVTVEEAGTDIALHARRHQLVPLGRFEVTLTGIVDPVVAATHPSEKDVGLCRQGQGGGDGRVLHELLGHVAAADDDRGVDMLDRASIGVGQSGRRAERVVSALTVLTYRPH